MLVDKVAIILSSLATLTAGASGLGAAELDVFGSWWPRTMTRTRTMTPPTIIDHIKRSDFVLYQTPESQKFSLEWSKPIGLFAPFQTKAEVTPNRFTYTPAYIVLFSPGGTREHFIGESLQQPPFAVTTLCRGNHFTRITD
ncbi:hypothetical protein R1flu_015094 [Riccia fluitans]|uniref:Uncharacterized protein n=1 Tax=Riccia fluitans TaxID=41844 RepID=A0ABD1YHY6_9MARC